MGAPGGRGAGVAGDAEEKQIPCGNDNKKRRGKSNSKGKCRSRFPAGMTSSDG